MNLQLESRRPRSGLLLAGALGLMFIGLGLFFFAGPPPTAKQAYDPLILVQMGFTLLLAWMLNVSLNRAFEVDKFEREFLCERLGGCITAVAELEKTLAVAALNEAGELSSVLVGLRTVRSRVREVRDFSEVCGFSSVLAIVRSLLQGGVEELRMVSTENPPSPVDLVGRTAAEQTYASFRRRLLEAVVQVNRSGR